MRHSEKIPELDRLDMEMEVEGVAAKVRKFILVSKNSHRVTG